MEYQQNILIDGEYVFPLLRHIKIQGSNFEIGRQLAELSIANHGDTLENHRVRDPLYAQVQQEYLRRNWPVLWERARGAAAAFGVDPGDEQYDFFSLWYNVDPPPMPGCSNAFYPPQRTADGHTYLSRNYEFSTGTFADVLGIDLPPEMKARMKSMMGEPYIMEWQPTDGGYASWAIHSNDLLGGAFDGINSAGLAVALMADEEAMGIMYEPHMGPPRAIGIGELQIVRFLLDTCASVAEAKKMLLFVKQFYQFVPCHYIIADATGASFIFENSPGRNQEIILDGGGNTQVCTNHQVHRYQNGEVPELTLENNSQWRYATLQARTSAQQKFTVADMRANSAAVGVGQLVQLMQENPLSRSIAANVNSRTLWYTLYDLTTRQVEIDFYLDSEITAEGKYVEERSQVFSFNVPSPPERRLQGEPVSAIAS